MQTYVLLERNVGLLLGLQIKLQLYHAPGIKRMKYECNDAISHYIIISYCAQFALLFRLQRI